MSKLRPIHPGEILKEEFMVPLNLSSNALSIFLCIPVTRVNDIVRKRRGVTADTALRLARYFGSSAAFWINLQASYDLRVAELSVGKRVMNEITPRKVA